MSVLKMDKEAKDPSQSGKRMRTIVFHRMVPNMITLTAMAAGLTSIQFAINMQWEKAIFAILIALLLDAMDGAMARLLNAASEFGSYLDTLSDFLAFGVSPSIILYIWLLNESGRVGWVAMLFYTSATALRLCRFNVEQKILPDWHKGFFSGIPSPAGAGLALLPLIIWLQYPDFFSRFAHASPLIGMWIIMVGCMMVSRVPTFSIKTISLPANLGMTVMACTALLLAALASAPWPTLTIVGLAYMASIPVAVIHFRKLKKDHQELEELEDLPL